jgi:hypothetical protein
MRLSVPERVGALGPGRSPGPCERPACASKGPVYIEYPAMFSGL